MRLPTWIRDVPTMLTGREIVGMRVFPITTKIILVYIIFILLSNFSSHYISLMMYRGELIKLSRQLLARDLRDVYQYANTQFEIFRIRKDRETARSIISERASLDFKNRMSIFIAVNRSGAIEMLSSTSARSQAFTDRKILDGMLRNLANSETEGFISFLLEGKKYFGVYKYNANWDLFLVRAEEYGEFYENSNRIFSRISMIILVITLACAVAGVFIIDYILRFIGRITASIIGMIRKNTISMIDMTGSQADDVAFLGMSFNALSDTINTLISIFQKFTNRDIVLKAYEEKRVKLEGSRRELTCLFSDIKNFTNMTEVLGTDIINLLNLHYTRVIKIILGQEGIIGSIIGDALLVVYSALGEHSEKMKSYQAVMTGYMIHDITEEIRAGMREIRDRILEERENLSPGEERVFRAVLIEVGVGIDGGDVFYGNIGSYERMTNTVIGDTVNSSSRMEGLNRIYKAPVICSEYVKADIIGNVENHGLEFLELDMVKVKGKDEGKRVYWPVPKKIITAAMRRDMKKYSEALRLYYRGDWKMSAILFGECSLPPAEVFIHRTREGKAPSNWNGIWTMDSK